MSPMVQLVLLFCLAADGSSCVERRPLLDDLLTPVGCLMAAQPMAAEFIRAHPSYRLVTWRCEIGHQDSKNA